MPSSFKIILKTVLFVFFLVHFFFSNPFEQDFQNKVEHGKQRSEKIAQELLGQIHLLNYVEILVEYEITDNCSIKFDYKNKGATIYMGTRFLLYATDEVLRGVLAHEFAHAIIEFTHQTRSPILHDRLQNQLLADAIAYRLVGEESIVACLRFIGLGTNEVKQYLELIECTSKNIMSNLMFAH